MLIYGADFTDGTIPSTIPAVSANGVLAVAPYGTAPRPGNIEIGTAPDGSVCLQETLRTGDLITNLGYRSEVGWNTEGQGFERWYALDIFLHSGINALDRLTIIQLHDQYDDATDSLWGSGHEKFVNAAFMLCKGSVEFWLPKYVAGTGLPDDTVSTGRIAGTSPAVFDRWARMVIHADWKTTTSGFIEAWYDGKKVCSEWAKPAAYVDPTGPLMRFGPYNHDTPVSVDTRIWYRNARVYDGAGTTEAAVLGALGIPRELGTFVG